jgi:hypothetical protein
MVSDPTKSGDREVGGLRQELLQADDEKLRRILAVVDDLSDPAVNRSLLDPVRGRLASLRPARPLRFVRLLFTPLDPVTVPLDAWRRDDPAIPRPILTPIADIVRPRLGELASAIDAIIENGQQDQTRAITEAGDTLWPRAAAILSTATIPPDWSRTGLPSAAFAPLAASIAAVLRRGPLLRRLVRDAELGALEPDREILNDILSDIMNEPPLCRAMIVRVILARSPKAVPLLRYIASERSNPDQSAALTGAIERAIEAILAQMASETAFVDTIGRARLADVGEEARRATAILRTIETEAASARYAPRLRAIRVRLDTLCRARLARGVDEALVTPLSSESRPVDGTCQVELETVARDLRTLDASAREVGAADSYDLLLARAADVVRAAAAAGRLTPMRECRLIELLEGPDAAEALYLKAFAET